MAKKKSKNNSHSKKNTAAHSASTSTSSDTLVKDSNHTSTPVAFKVDTDATVDSQLDKSENAISSPEAPAQDPIQPQPNDPQVANYNTDGIESTEHSYTPRDHDSHVDQTQEAWSSLHQGPNGKAYSHNVGDHNGTLTFENRHQEQQLPIERAAPRQYEDDDDENDHTRNEHSPLIRSNSRDSNYSSGDETQRRDRENRDSEGKPATWTQWAIDEGLHPSTWNRQTYIKFGLLATLLTLIVLSFTVFRVQDHIKDLLRYIDGHKRVGAVLFIASYTIACMLFLPGSLFTIGAGFLFKPFPLALLVVLLGDIFAAILAFIFGRYVFYDWVKGMMSKHPKFSALDQVIKDDGWKIVVMLRLTPIPFNLITYFFCITSIQLFTVVWATCIGVLPGSCIGIWIGSLLKGLSGIDNPQLERKNLVILGMNIGLIICCILSLSLFGKRSLRKAMKRLEQHQALTNLQEVEIVIEGAAAVIRELEDNASIPPSLRSTIIEQLATEEINPDFYFGGDGMAAAQRRHLGVSSSDSVSRNTDEEAGYGGDDGEGATATSTLIGNQQRNKSAATSPSSQSSGFTRGEKITFVVIATVALLDICICLPLYYYFSNLDGKS
ncbi:hypothetical protein BGX21_009492 [Mortierella sp. AD011]|nr:hypothetical protein BGX20_000783 [Mortierella sp. AD010]KAF9396521.1 hypothetical protein BGX21_009492 [Mortierella sp. AD011]